VASPEEVQAARAELARRELARRAAAKAAEAPAARSASAQPYGGYTAEVQNLRTPEQQAENVRGARSVGAGVSRLLTAPGALVTAGAQAAGIPGADVAGYNQGVKALESQIAGGEVVPEAAMAGELASGVALPIGAASKATGWLRAVFEGAKTGAVTGAVLGSDQEATTPGEAATSAATRLALGGGLGAGVSGAVAVAPAVRNAITKLADAGRPIAETVKLMAEKAAGAFRDAPLTLAQQTGSPTLRALQAQVAGKRAFDFQNEQLEKFGATVDAIGATMKGSRSPQAAADKLAPALGKASAQLQDAASKEYGQALQAVKSVASRDPSPLNIPFQKFEAALIDAEAAGGKSWKTMLGATKEGDPVLYDAIETIAKARALGARGMGVGDVIEIKAAANILRKGLKKMDMNATDQMKNRLGKDIARAVDEDIDTFLSGLQPGQASPTAEALTLLKAANTQYKERLAQIASHKSSFVVQALGKVPKNPEEAFEALIRKDPDQQLRALAIMRNSAPEVIDDIKAWKLSDVSTKLRSQVAAGNISAVDPAVFIKELTNGSDVVASKFWTPKELADIKSGVATARLYLSDMPGGAPTSSKGAPEIGRLGAAATTMSAPFVTMHLYKLMGSGNVEKMLFTPAGLAAFQTLRATYTKPTAATVRALTVLSNLAQSGSAPEQTPEE
jgi:hypothetical protein